MYGRPIARTREGSINTRSQAMMMLKISIIRQRSRYGHGARKMIVIHDHDHAAEPMSERLLYIGSIQGLLSKYFT